MSKILYKKENNIAYITLNRPEKLNIIDREMNQSLHEIWNDIIGDKDIYVAILSGMGGNFCAGFDLNVFYDELKKDKYDWSKSAMFGKQRGTPNENNVLKPVITAVDGVVNGMGTWLMLQGDIRIASEETNVGLGEARLDFPVEFSALITHQLPFGIAGELLYTAKPIAARRLYDIGVINKIVAKDELISVAEKYARDIGKCGQRSIQAMKELVIKGQYMNKEEAISLAAERIVPIVNSDETLRAITGFIERNKD
jgi:enoyl-CoA hydratase/carnithine racemase